jgi:predicted transcriptional regulator
MKMLRDIYGIMGRGEKEDYARLLALEINAYLDKIYRTMKRKVPLPRQEMLPEQLVLKSASLGATKSWEFMPNSREEAAKGHVGRLVVVTRGLDDEGLRKQRALLMAAEFYVYHAFANHPDPRYFRSITCQNQYLDLVRKLFRRKNAHDIRERAMRYVIGEIREHRLAHLQGHGWHTSVAKLDRHYPEIAEALGSSEQTFREMFRRQHGSFSPEMLRQEEDLVRKEIEDISRLSCMLRGLEKRKHPARLEKLTMLHLANLETFKDVLEEIRRNIDRWIVVDTEEHGELRRKVGMTGAELRRLLQAEAEAGQIDINKVHILFRHFKKEKINILRDLKTLESASQM